MDETGRGRADDADRALGRHLVDDALLALAAARRSARRRLALAPLRLAAAGEGLGVLALLLLLVAPGLGLHLALSLALGPALALGAGALLAGWLGLAWALGDRGAPGAEADAALHARLFDLDAFRDGRAARGGPAAQPPEPLPRRPLRAVGRALQELRARL